MGGSGKELTNQKQSMVRHLSITLHNISRTHKLLVLIKNNYQTVLYCIIFSSKYHIVLLFQQQSHLSKVSHENPASHLHTLVKGSF